MISLTCFVVFNNILNVTWVKILSLTTTYLILAQLLVEMIAQFLILKEEKKDGDKDHNGLPESTKETKVNKPGLELKIDSNSKDK